MYFNWSVPKIAHFANVFQRSLRTPWEWACEENAKWAYHSWGIITDLSAIHTVYGVDLRMVIVCKVHQLYSNNDSNSTSYSSTSSQIGKGHFPESYFVSDVLSCLNSCYHLKMLNNSTCSLPSHSQSLTRILSWWADYLDQNATKPHIAPARLLMLLNPSK